MGMRVVVDAIPITGSSTAIVTEHLLRAWADLKTDDEIHVVTGPNATFGVSSTLHVHRVPYGRIPMLHRLWAQSVTIPRLARKINADIVLGLIASTTITPLPCPRSIVVHDMRHELRPDQFAGHTLLFKRVSYWLGYRQARAIACISERTKYDLLSTHPNLKRTLVRVVHHGADHTAQWPARTPGPDYAIAFPWLPHREYQAYFTSASVVVFPSDFEGFGLPAIEAMALGIPLVITPDAALLEVTGGHAVTLPGESPAALAEAVVEAGRLSPRALQDARTHAGQFTWARSATALRAMLLDAVQDVSDPQSGHRFAPSSAP
jgi:hypothetical protein